MVSRARIMRHFRIKPVSCSTYLGRYVVSLTASHPEASALCHAAVIHFQGPKLLSSHWAGDTFSPSYVT